MLETKRESTRARNELRHYKEGARFRLLFPEIPAGSVDEAVVVARRAGSPMRPGQAEDGPAVKTCPTHTEVYATKSGTFEVEERIYGGKAAGESRRPASESRPYMGARK